MAVLFFALFGLGNAWGQADGQSSSIERQVKAAYLYKFASYVEWPDGTFAQPDSPLVIGVIGADALADDLAQVVAGHTVNGRVVMMRKLKRGEPLTGLHILFVGSLEKGHLREVFAEVKSHPMLTVTESDEAHAMGSMVHFVITGDRLRFEVALAPVGLGRLKISARMLTAAYKVISGSSSDADDIRLAQVNRHIDVYGTTVRIATHVHASLRMSLSNT